MESIPDVPPSAGPELHVDEAEFLVRLVTVPSAIPSETKEAFLTGWSGPGVSLDEAARLTSAVAWDKQAGVHHPFVAKQTHSRVEWGASGTFVQFVVDVINNVGSEAIVAGMAYALSQMRRKRQDDGAGAPFGDLDSKRWSAIRAVSRAFEEVSEHLQVTDARADAESATFHVTSSSGREYRASVSRLPTGDEYVHAVRVPSRVL